LSERESKCLAGVTLSVCTGASVYLMTGKGDVGFFLAVLLSVIVTPIIAFSPRGGKAAAKELYWCGLAVLVGPFLLMKVGYHGRSGRPHAWEDLQARYAAKGPEPSGLETGREVVVNRKVGQFMVQPYAHKRVYTHFGEAGAYFALSFPMSWVYDPVFVPIKHIRECRMDSMKSGYATLAPIGVALEIDVADDEGHVRAWCEHHEIPDGSEPRS
jgi:hypothetical protein